MPHLSEWQWLLAIAAALCVGLSKAGFAGLGLVAVATFASIFGARDSTGVVLPMLIVADIGAVLVFKQHARWDFIRRTPVACVGVVLGTLIMQRLDNAAFRPVILPKFEVVGTLAWFFFIINLFKVPFSVSLGVIHGTSLTLNATLVPAILVGLFSGRWLIGRIPQRAFEGLLLVFAAGAALRLLVV